MSREKNDLFSTSHLREGLKERAVKSTGITLVSQVIKLILQIGSMAIMARLLEPSDFGLVAMVTVFTGLALQFMEGGLSMATIQRNDITHHQVSNLFWINVALGVGLCLLGIFLSPLVASVYEEPRLAMIMVAMSFTFLIGGFSVQHDALLRRQMRFKVLSIIDVMSKTFGVIAGITAAILGLQYWALVISPIVTFGSITIMRWSYARWLPSMISRGSGVRPLLNFGANLTGANFIGYVAANITPFTIGYLGGAQSLGMFDRANKLASIPSSQILPPVMNVLQPTLARVADDTKQLRHTITSIMGKLVLVAMFITLTTAVLADWIVYLLLGEGWNDVVPIVQILSVFTLVEPIARFLAISLIAVGNARAILRWKFITFIILIVSIGIGSLWGVVGIVTAYALSGVFIRLPGFLFYASKFLPISFYEFLKVLLPSVICALGTIAVVYFLRNLFEIENPLVGLMIFTIISSMVYIIFCALVKPARKEIIEIIGLFKFLISRKRTVK